MSSKRQTVLANGFIYHVYNKTYPDLYAFSPANNADTFLKMAYYYRSNKAKTSYSHLRFNQSITEQLHKDISNPDYFKVSVLAYCFMPNHFHLLLKQEESNGISNYMGKLVNAFTRYYNIKNNRIGPLFRPRFKSVLIQDDDQLVHTSRYINLNPYSANIVKSKQELLTYKWSSLQSYHSGEGGNFVSTEPVLKYFDSNRDKYIEFVMNNAEHQRRLELLKNITTSGVYNPGG